MARAYFTTRFTAKGEVMNRWQSWLLSAVLILSSSVWAQVEISVTDAPPEDADPLDIETFEQHVANFNAKYPDIILETNTGGYDPSAYAAKIAGGTLETTFGVWFTETQKFIQQGVVADITDQLAESPWAACLNPSSQTVVTDENGRVYGIAVNQYGLGLTYNRSLFEQAGLDPNQPPTTWQELREYAKAIKDATGIPGFAFNSINNTGGWHYTTALYTYGVDAQTQVDGKWTATFNDPRGVEFLQLLKDMRFVDNSLTEQQLLDPAAVNDLMALGQLGMMIGSVPGNLQEMGADINDYGYAAIPQGGGSATLGGGYAWMVNGNARPEQIAAAIDWITFRNFDPQSIELDLQTNQALGRPIGFPDPAVLTGECQAARQALIEEYSNVPTENFDFYVTAMENIAVKSEPPIETQQMYAAIDPVVQAVLTDENADPQALIDQAASQFQTQVLDNVE
jgi:multiple sugar transport system substrate-binding protein